VGAGDDGRAEVTCDILVKSFYHTMVDMCTESFWPRDNCGILWTRVKDTGCSEMRYLGLGVVLDAGDSYRQTVLTGLEGALSMYMQPGAIVF
jgi:hypothetical protein